MRLLLIICLLTSAGCVSLTARHSSGAAQVVSPRDAPSYVIGNGSGSATLFFNGSTGASDLAMSTLRLAPGAQVPPHRHPQSSESLYLLSGEVEMNISGQRYKARAGDAIYIPQGALHSAKVPKKSKELRAVQIYCGPGPEQRFTKGKPVQHQ